MQQLSIVFNLFFSILVLNIVSSKFSKYRKIITPTNNILVLGHGGKYDNIGRDKRESLQMKIDELE
jgi:hypothetical protein